MVDVGEVNSLDAAMIVSDEEDSEDLCSCLDDALDLEELGKQKILEEVVVGLIVAAAFVD